MNYAHSTCTHIYKHIYQLIGIVVRVFANGPGDRGSIPGQAILKKWYLMPPYLTRSFISYGSRVSRAIQGKESHTSLHIGVVAIEK